MGKTLSELLKERFGVKTTYRVNPLGATVGVSIVKIASYNPNRLGLIIFNLSANDVYIAPDSDVAATKGIKLQPNGGGTSFVWSEDFELCSFEWYAIASAAASTIYVLEVLSAE